MTVAVVAAVAFSVFIATFDALVRIPGVIVVPVPQGLWFYPLIALVVEVVFHLLPLSILLWASRPLLVERRVWPCMVAVACIEPIFQMVLGASPEGLIWIDVVVGVHILAINLAQLAVFRRYDVVSSLALRLVYYCGWHIVWGYLRVP